MTRKNTLGRTVCFGILATAAATMLMANTVAFAAGPGEDSEELVQEGDHISGKVTEVASDSITISVLGRRPGSGFEGGMPDRERPAFSEGERPEPPEGQNPPEPPEGQTPPERPESEQSDGQNPPELPDGQTPPERPEGEGPDLSDGERPEPPEGMDEHFMNGESGSEVTVNIDANTVITKGIDAESATLSDIAVGSMVVISLDGDTAVSIMILDIPA